MGEGELKWRRIERRELLACPIFTVTERLNEGPGGRSARFVVLEARDWAVAVPVLVKDGEPHFLMVRQYRHGSDEVSVEFPGGVVERGEDPAAAAARELHRGDGLLCLETFPCRGSAPQPGYPRQPFPRLPGRGPRVHGRDGPRRARGPRLPPGKRAGGPSLNGRAPIFPCPHVRRPLPGGQAPGGPLILKALGALGFAVDLSRAKTRRAQGRAFPSNNTNLYLHSPLRA